MAGPWEKYGMQAAPVATGPWAKYGAAAPAAPPAPAPQDPEFNYDPDSALGGLRTAAGGFLEGVPVIGPYLKSGAEHVTAAGASLVNGQPYDEALARVQALGKAEKEANPYVDTGAQLAGGIAGTAPLIAAAPVAFGVTGATVPARAAAGFVSGGALGAADGAVRGGTEGAAVGLAIGAPLGAIGPIAGNLGSRGYEALKRLGVERVAARQAGTSREAVNAVTRGLEADDALGTFRETLRQAGPDAMLADAGPSTRSMLDTSIARAGPGASKAAQRIEARATAARGTADEALDQSFGRVGESSSRDLIVYGDKRNPLDVVYQRAYETPIDYSAPQAREIEDIIANRVPPAAIRKANELMRTEGNKSKQILADISDDGTITYKTLPDVRQLDYIKRALDEVASEADGKGALGGTTQTGRAYSNLARDLRDRLKELVPEYGTALGKAANEIRKKQARDAGFEVLSNKLTRADVQDLIKGSSEAELGKLREGIRQHIDDTLATVTRTVADGNTDAREAIKVVRDLSSRANHEKIASIIGQDEAGKLFRAMDSVTRSLDLRASVATNSRTFGRQTAERAVDEATGDGVLNTLAGLKGLRAPQMAAEKIFGVGPEAQLARRDKVWADISDLLTKPAGQANTQLLEAISKATSARPQIAQQAGLLDALVSGGLAGLAPQGGKLHPLLQGR